MKGAKPNKKKFVGRVVSDKMDKTVSIELEIRKRHPLYKKFVKQRRKIKAHDERNEAVIGDLVKVEEIRPVSKEKTWRVIEILEKEQRG